MSKLLVQEPPLIVLRSLAKRFGLNEAIVLQQLHFLGRLGEDGWVQKTAVELVPVFPFWSEATIKRTLKDLRATGLLEGETVPVPGGGRAYRHRVAYAQLSSAPDQMSSASAQFERTPTNGVKEGQEVEEPPTPRKRGKSILSPEEEPHGFAQWLGQHVAICARWGIERQVPRAGTTTRSDLARMFAALRDEGYGLEDFETVSEVVLASSFNRENGHSKFATVLRRQKFGERLDDAWKARERASEEQAEAERRSQYEGLVAN